MGYAIKPLPPPLAVGENDAIHHVVPSDGTEYIGDDRQEQDQSDKIPKRIPPVLILVPRNHPCVAWCFVGAVVHVDFKPCTDEISVQEEKKDSDCREENTRNDSQGNGDKSVGALSKSGHRRNLRDADSVGLIQCSPDPNAIVACLEMVVNGDLTLASFPTSAIQDLDQVQDFLAASPKDEDRRKWILDISRDLQVIGNSPESHYQYHHPDAKKYGTSKHAGKPRIKRRYWYVLGEMEKVIPVIKPLQKEALTSTESALSRGLNVHALQKHLETQAIPSEEVCSSVATEEAAVAGKDALSMSWNVPNIHAKSNNHPISRVDYLKQKKFPQIRWLLQKLHYVLQYMKTSNQNAGESRGTPKSARIRLLDVGGGRGDLAVAMAQAFPDIQVTVVDLNESSLQAGKAFAEQMMGKVDADDRTAFVCADFASFARDLLQSPEKEGKPFDIVIAWHACGDLSDFALEFAMETDASFIICPCCFTKRYINEFTPKWIEDYTSGRGFTVEGSFCREVSTKVDVLQPHEPYTGSLEQDIGTVQRIAEINENSDVSRRAMLLVNTMRLFALKREVDTLFERDNDDESKVENGSKVGGYILTLEEYDLKHSSKNLVLVGIRNKNGDTDSSLDNDFLP
jgi:hypothetical protein